MSLSSALADYLSAEAAGESTRSAQRAWWRAFLDATDYRDPGYPDRLTSEIAAWTARPGDPSYVLRKLEHEHRAVTGRSPMPDTGGWFVEDPNTGRTSADWSEIGSDIMDWLKGQTEQDAGIGGGGGRQSGPTITGGPGYLDLQPSPGLGLVLVLAGAAGLAFLASR